MGSTEKFHKATLMPHMANVQVVCTYMFNKLLHLGSAFPITNLSQYILVSVYESKRVWNIELYNLSDLIPCSYKC